MHRHNHAAGNHHVVGNHHAIGGHHHVASFQQTAHVPFHNHAHHQPPMHAAHHQPAMHFQAAPVFAHSPAFLQPTRHHLLFSRFRSYPGIEPLLPYWDVLDYINEADILLFLTLNYLQQQAITDSIRRGQYYSLRAAINAAQFNNTFNTFTVGSVQLPNAPHPIIPPPKPVDAFFNFLEKTTTKLYPEVAAKLPETFTSKNPVIQEVISRCDSNIKPITFNKDWFNHKSHADAFFVLYDKYITYNKPQAAANLAMARLNNTSPEEAAMIVRMNSNANDLHTQVMRLLEPYIEENRLNNLNFKRGFTFFVDTQSTNREANYRTAVELQLRASRGEDLKTLLSKPNVEFLRSKYPHTFGINSRTLNKALNDARCLVEQAECCIGCVDNAANQLRMAIIR